MLTIKPQLITKYAYNSRGFLDSLECKQGNQNIFKERLSYDVDGQIIAQHWKQGVSLEDSLGYEYDSRKQLTKWINPQGSYTQYAYDNVGNRVTTSQYDAPSGLTVNTGYAYELGKNRLMKRNVSIQDTTDYSYYQDGSMKRSQFATYNGRFWNNKIENYGYGYNGLLTSYSLENTFSENVNCFSESGSFAWVWTYRYSPGGERESKRLVTSPLGDGYASHNWNYYLLGGNKQQLAVYNGRETSRTDCYSSGNRVYFYPTEYLTYGNGSSALMTTRPNGNQEYKVTDHLGSTRVVVDSTGYILSQYDYEPFGKPLAKTGLDSRKSFIDKEKDYESGLGDFGVRKFDDGRFTSIDPLWEKFRAWSPYQYGYDNPLRMFDPSGMAPTDDNGLVTANELAKQHESDKAKAKQDKEPHPFSEQAGQGVSISLSFVPGMGAGVSFSMFQLNRGSDAGKTNFSFSLTARAGLETGVSVNGFKIASTLSNEKLKSSKIEGYGLDASINYGIASLAGGSTLPKGNTEASHFAMLPSIFGISKGGMVSPRSPAGPALKAGGSVGFGQTFILNK